MPSRTVLTDVPAWFFVRATVVCHSCGTLNPRGEIIFDRSENNLLRIFAPRQAWGYARRNGHKHRTPCMTGFAERTRPQGACSKTAGDERRRTIQCTPTTPDTHPPRSISTRSPAFTPSQQSNGIFAYAARPPAASLHAHAFCSSRSPLARPLPCADRTIGERNLTTPPGLLAHLRREGEDRATNRSREGREHLFAKTNKKFEI